MKRFFYLCAALLCLSLAFHFGYTTARAQAPGNPPLVLAGMSGAWGVLTANGDIYYSSTGSLTGPWVHGSNVFGGSPVPIQQQSWGQLKSHYAPSRAPTSQTPTDH